MTPPFDFSQFERESAKLLSDMRGSVERLAAYEQNVRSGNVSQAGVESKVAQRYTPAAAESGVGATTQDIKSRGAATEELAARQRALTAAQGASSSSERVFAQTMAQSAGNMRTNGALTNEFVEEAKRGEVTVRELGAQVSGTIAKFGGWILAGSAVYFAFDALKFLKAGAIDATSGVTEMSRVIHNLDVHSATQEVSELAAHFNLPVGTVTEAAFAMGKAFHSQAGALLATKAALYAIKVGEIDAGTATRYLISIVQGFHLPVQSLGGLFDELLTAQKHYAIDLPTLMAGVGRAAGAFRAAGGDVHTLIALITTLQHVSGQTGTVIGTAIQRSPHFIATPKNQSILEQFGIDPNAKIGEIYSEAITAAQGKSGKVQREIAEGLFGPKYGARVGIFLLQNKSLFEKVFSQTSAGHSKGEAENQLQIVLQKTSEQISKLGHTLEQIGLGLASGHLLDSLGVLLTLLNGALTITNSLVHAFDELPEGVQKALAWLIQASLVIRGFSRLNLGETIAGRGTPGPVRGAVAGLFGHESESATGRRARSAFLTEEDTYQKKLASTRKSQFDAQYRQSIALESSKAKEAELQRATNTYGVGSPQAAAAEKQAVASRQVVAAGLQNIQNLAIDEATAAGRLAEAQASVVASRRSVIGGLNTQAAIAEAERRGVPVPSRFGKGGIESPVFLGGKSATPKLDEYHAAMERAGVVTSAVGQEAVAAGGLTSRAATGISGLGLKLGGLKGAFGSMGGALNGLLGSTGNLLFAAFTVGILSELLTNQAEDAGKKIEAVTAQSGSEKASLQKFRELKAGSREGEGGETFSERLTNFFTEHTSLGPIPIPEFGLGPGKGIGEERQEVEKGEAATHEAIAKEQAKARSKGQPVPFRFVKEITNDIKRIKNSGESRKKINEALDEYEQELHQSRGTGQEKALALVHEEQAAHAKNQDVIKSLQALKAEQIGEQLGSTIGKVGGTEGVPFDAAQAHRAALIYQAQVEKLSTATDAKAVGELLSARQKYFSGVQSAIASELSRSVLLARTPGEKTQAYQTALDRYRSFAGSGGEEVEKQEQRVNALVKQQQELQEKVSAPPSRAKAEEGGDPAAALKKLDTRLGAEKRTLSKLLEGQNEKQRYVKELIQKVKEEEYQTESALRKAEEGAQEALTSDPIKQIEEKLRFVGREISAANRIFGRDSTQVLALITEQRQAQQQLLQDRLSRIQAEGNLASAGILEQVPKEKAGLYGKGGLLDQLRFEKEHRKAFDPKAIIELEAQVKQAQAQLVHDVEAEATQLTDARFGIQEARANYQGNTAEAARIAVEKAKYDVAHAQTPLEKLTAQATLVQALATKRDAVANARVESIQFEASIAKISTQEEIEQLETLLHTYKLSLTARRHLREQIHSLKSQLANEGKSFDLNVGDFSLPTAYDIRRAVLGGSGGKGGATVNQTNYFHIENHSSDPNVVGKAIGQALGGAADSAARSAGVR